MSSFKSSDFLIITSCLTHAHATEKKLFAASLSIFSICKNKTTLTSFELICIKQLDFIMTKFLRKCDKKDNLESPKLLLKMQKSQTLKQ